MPDPSKPYQMYSDASVEGTGGILMQDGKIIAYTGRKFTATQRNWTTTEQELYALVSNFEQWRCYLEGAKTELFTDHHPLVWICTQPQLTRKQTRWVIYLQRFDFDLKYVPGKQIQLILSAAHLTFACSLAVAAHLSSMMLLSRTFVFTLPRAAGLRVFQRRGESVHHQFHRLITLLK
jgi:hypothetical protein